MTDLIKNKIVYITTRQNAILGGETSGVHLIGNLYYMELDKPKKSLDDIKKLLKANNMDETGYDIKRLTTFTMYIPTTEILSIVTLKENE